MCAWNFDILTHLILLDAQYPKDPFSSRESQIRILCTIHVIQDHLAIEWYPEEEQSLLHYMHSHDQGAYLVWWITWEFGYWAILNIRESMGKCPSHLHDDDGDDADDVVAIVPKVEYKWQMMDKIVNYCATTLMLPDPIGRRWFYKLIYFIEKEEALSNRSWKTTMKSYAAQCWRVELVNYGVPICYSGI